MKTRILTLILSTLLFLTACNTQPALQTTTQTADPTNTSTTLTQTPMKILMVIAPDGYQDTEYGTPKKILQEAGYEVVTTSTTKIAKGSLGGKTTVNILMDEVNPADYGAIVFIGGPGSHDYFDYEPAHNLANDFYNSGKLTTAICAAPSILANAGILRGKTITAFPNEAGNIKNKGATYTGNSIEQDGLIITGNGPSAAQAFGEKIVEALKNSNQ